MNSYKCSYKTLEVGWSFSPVIDFQRTLGRSILFAPIHPNQGGFLSKVDRMMNLNTFERLTKLLPTYKLTVRTIGDPSHSGVPIIEGVHYVEGAKSVEDSLSFMTGFDLIVSRHMFAWLAVAIGKPTLMFGEFIAPHYGASEEKLVFATDWKDYKDIMRFPLDVLNEEDIHFLVERATYSDYEIADWKCRMIGGPFNESLYLDEMEKIVNGQKIVSNNGSSGEVPKEEGARKREQASQHEWVSALQKGT